MKKLLFIGVFLLTSSLSLSAQDIFTSLKSRNYENLENYLKSKKSTSIYNEKGLTPLWMAVFKNDTTAVKLLIKYDVDVNFTEKKGMHPIMIGCLVDSYESVKLLLENDVDVNWKSKNSRNQQPIRFASQGGSLRLIKLLLKYGADMESTPDDKATPLMASIHAKKYKIAKFYFENGAKTDVKGRDGEYIIHEAINTGNLEMVRLAIENNAPLDVKTPKGKTTWKLAKATKNSQIKKLIKEALGK